MNRNPMAGLALAALTLTLGAGTAGAQAPPSDARAEALLVDPTASAQARLEALEALDGTGVGLFDRRELVADLQQVLIDRRQPADLRLAIFGRLTELFFPMTHLPHETTAPQPADHHRAHAAVESFNDSVRLLLDDPDPRLVRGAFSWLAIFGDQLALSRVVEFLSGDRELPLATSDAVGLLTFRDGRAYLPLIHDVFRRSDDPATREEALRVLASHDPARQDLLAVARSPRESVRLRVIALGGLAAADTQAFPEIAAPLLADAAAPDELKAAAISLVRPVRSTPPYRERKLGGYDDAFDRGVRALAAGQSEVAELARGYLLETDPTWSPAAS